MLFLFLFLTHATYTMKLIAMQLMQHNTLKATHAMQNYATCNTTHEMQPMPPIILKQLYGCLSVYLYG